MPVSKKKFLALAAVITAGTWSAYFISYGMPPADVVRKLSGLRLSLELYRQQYKRLPASFEETLRAGTLEAPPELKLSGHLKRASVKDTGAMVIKDTGGWAYVNNPQDPDFGLLYIDCSHKDLKGRFWSEF
ncbi:MAG: hypothetical protein COX65_09590 [Elusimicrobia bacterium CG_4_10_14_0_2_um_filter_56_8]|nr:MAG: hypothetical protein AUJ51_00195 [Elusimicrobia bacterium CG1_02_56_21]PJA11823.1 MAG: hypothetical protein COX65_09590 [Elusimicrobia bacterium CG_4_10_14_0_2_um_filter_56_8]